MHLQVFKHTSEYSANSIPEPNMHSIFVVAFKLVLILVLLHHAISFTQECDLFPPLLQTSVTLGRALLCCWPPAPYPPTGVIKPFNTYSDSLTARLLTTHPNQNLGFCTNLD